MVGERERKDVLPPSARGKYRTAGHDRRLSIVGGSFHMKVMVCFLFRSRQLKDGSRSGGSLSKQQQLLLLHGHGRARVGYPEQVVLRDGVATESYICLEFSAIRATYLSCFLITLPTLPLLTTPPHSTFLHNSLCEYYHDVYFLPIPRSCE